MPTTIQMLEPVMQELFPACDRTSAEHIIEILSEKGLIDCRMAETLFARAEVERRVRNGRGRCRAMEEVASQLCCSYEKVRKIIYSNT